MQPNDKPKEKGRFAARVEFLAVQEDVHRFLAEGHSLRAIFDFYREKGVFTMRYQTFCNYAGGKIPAAGPRAKKATLSAGAKPALGAPTVPATPSPAKPADCGNGVPPEPKSGPKILEKPADGFRDKLPDDNF